MATAATEVGDSGEAIGRCWCCGATVDETSLTRLGDHPEVGLCVGCARWVYRRSRLTAHQNDRDVRARVDRGAARVRARVMSVGAHDWPVVGAVLRWLDRHAP